MAIPTYDQFIEPLLRVLAEHHDGLRSSQVYERVADCVALTAQEREQRLPSGKQRIYHNRIGWAHDRLKRAGYSAAPSRGLWQLTSSGRDFVALHPQALSDAEVDAIADVPADSTTSAPNVAETVAASPTPSQKQPPDERIDAAVQELQAAVRRDVLELVRRAPPVFFEQLILQLLQKMGYGLEARDLQHTGQSGDGGIDGVISLDRLGLDKVYVQAKRYAEGNTVGRPDIQGFVGALAPHSARRGIFFTTSSFSSQALDYASSVPDGLVLVDGNRLAELMIEFEVGVSIERTIRIPRVDLDFFEDA